MNEETLIIGGSVIIISIFILVFFIRKIVGEINNPYAFTQYFDKSIIKVQVYEVEPTEPISEDNPKVSKVMITQREIGLYGNEGFYYNGMTYVIPYEVINISRTMRPSMMVVRVGRFGIMPIACYLIPSEVHKSNIVSVDVHPSRIIFPIKFSEKIRNEVEFEMKKYKENKTSFNLGMIRPANEMLNYLTDSNITSFYSRQRSILKKVESSAEQMVKFVATLGVVIIGSVIIITMAVIAASDIIVKAIEVSAG